MCQNIDDFNRGAALILAHLYQQFPIPCFLNVTELDRHEDLLANDNGRRDSRHVIYGAAVQFLSDEGFLRFTAQTARGAFFSDVVLTSKGLAALQKTPEALRDPKPSDTIGDTLIKVSQDFLKGGSMEIIRQAIRVLLGG